MFAKNICIPCFAAIFFYQGCPEIEKIGQRTNDFFENYRIFSEVIGQKPEIG